jgi:hypothetical protein
MKTIKSFIQLELVGDAEHGDDRGAKFLGHLCSFGHKKLFYLFRRYLDVPCSLEQDFNRHQQAVERIMSNNISNVPLCSQISTELASPLQRYCGEDERPTD